MILRNCLIIMTLVLIMVFDCLIIFEPFNVFPTFILFLLRNQFNRLQQMVDNKQEKITLKYIYYEKKESKKEIIIFHFPINKFKIHHI